MWRIRSALVVIIGVFLSMAPELASAEPYYDSYRDLHQNTRYGALLFNKGAIRDIDNRSRKNFFEVEDSGQVKLPPQSGYCFVFNHYTGDESSLSQHSYSAKIIKIFSDGRKSTKQIITRTFTPTNDIYSSSFPSLCVTVVQKLRRVEIEFTSDSGDDFNWNISFDVR